MKFNKWTIGLAAVGVVSLASAVQAEEKPSSVMTAVSSTTLSGYVDTSAQWNLGGGHSHTPGYAYNTASKANGFNLNVAKLSLEKVADAADAWGAGYKVDALFGPNANAVGGLGTQSPGTFGTSSDFALKQAYVDLKAPVGNGLDFKMGVFDTIIGYEVFDAGSNPNFTRSYGYTIEPTTHTGLLATYQVAEAVSLSGGVAETFGPSINQRAFLAGNKAQSYTTYLGSLALTAPKDWGFVAGSTLYGGVINGFNGGNAADQTSFYAGASLNTPVKELKVGASYDYVAVGNNGTQKSGYQNATGVYGTFQVSEKFSLNLRGEYFSQSGYLANLYNNANGGLFGATGTVLPKEAIEGTLTAQYDLWKNVISRVELRWDHATSGHPFGGETAAALGHEKNSFELIGNVIYKF